MIARHSTLLDRLQREKIDLHSDFQNALGGLKRRLPLGIGGPQQWMVESSVNADTLISGPLGVEITLRGDHYHLWERAGYRQKRTKRTTYRNQIANNRTTSTNQIRCRMTLTRSIQPRTGPRLSVASKTQNHARAQSSVSVFGRYPPTAVESPETGSYSSFARPRKNRSPPSVHPRGLCCPRTPSGSRVGLSWSLYYSLPHVGGRA